MSFSILYVSAVAPKYVSSKAITIFIFIKIFYWNVENLYVQLLVYVSPGRTTTEGQ